MNNDRLKELAGLNEADNNNKVMYNEKMKNVVKAILLAWDHAKSMDIDVDSFEKDLNNYITSAKQDIGD